MRKILAYILTSIHLLFFGLGIVIFDLPQRIAMAIGGQRAQQKTVQLLNFFLTWSLLLLGSIPRWRQATDLPTDRPLIMVSNHQSLYDIPIFFWKMRKHDVKFISKIELSKGVPSVSYNLRKGGNALIDRKDPRQALPEIKRFAEFIEEHNYAAVIFPEGTRSRDGVPKFFSPNGLKTMLKYAPSALVVPVSINNSWKLVRFGKFPMDIGVQPTWDIHPPIDPKGRPFEEVFEQVQAIIKEGIVLK